MYKPNNYMPSPSPTNDPLRIREYHVSNLLQRYPNARIVIQDKSVVDVPVRLNNGQFLNFRVHLQPTFPQLPPIIQLLATAAEHRFLEKNQLVVHERLRMWNSNDNLGEVLFQVFQDFINYPPRIISYALQNPIRTTPSPSSATTPTPTSQPQPPVYQSGGSYGSTNTSPSPVMQQTSSMTSPTFVNNSNSGANMGTVYLPSIPDVFPEVEEVSRNPSELKQLLESEWHFKNWFDQLEYIQSSKKIFDELRAKNMDHAKDNIKRNKELEERSAEYKRLKEEVQSLKLNVQEKTLKQKEINERYQPQNVLKVLNQKIEDIEEETEKMGDDFGSRGGDWDQFYKDYMEKRSLYHLRQEKKLRFTATYVK